MGLSTIHVGDIEYDIEWDSLWCHQTLLENHQKSIDGPLPTYTAGGFQFMDFMLPLVIIHL